MTRVNTRLSDSDRSNIRDKCRTIMHKRRLLAPKIWQAESDATMVKQLMTLLPPDVRACYEILHEKYGGKFKTALHRTGDTTVRLVNEAGDKEVGHVQVNFRRYVYFIEGGWRSGAGGFNIKPGHPMYAPILDYCEKCADISEKYDFVLDLVTHVVNNCNTFGQIDRVWPDLLTTINNGKVVAAQKQVRSSNLPDDLDSKRVILDRDRATLLLAQAAVLPDYEREGPEVWGELQA